ncbi:MAG TPA: DUF6057 family protein [Bacteroidales bacterium]|nr:DUF6057 family protein [Bacteroidales bacterium]HPO66509.1 DUF6057 family protein [Bacteroidales bacterium]
MKSARNYILHILVLIVLIIFAFLTNAHKIWDIQQIVFYNDTQFWREHIAIIGGPSEWLTNLICQFFYFPIIGNFLLGVLLFILFEIFLLVVNKISNSNYNFIISFIIPALFIYMLKNPIFPLNFIFQLIISFILVYLFLRFYSLKIYIDSILFSLFFIALFYTSSFLSALIFSLSVILYDLNQHKGKIWYRLANIILLSTIVYLIAKYVMFLPNDRFLIGKELFTFQTIRLTRVLFIFFAVMLLLIVAFLLHKKLRTASPAPLILNAGIGIVIFIGSWLIPLNDENILPDTFRYFDHTKKWDKILSKAQKLHSNDRIVNYYTNKALYYTGKLSTNLFDYPQSWGEYALFLTTLTEPNTLMDNSNIFYELGHIGAARYWAFEAQTVFENRPEILKRLAECNIILENYQAAKPFALKLSKSIVHRTIANYYLRLINDTTLIAQDKVIVHKRKCTPKVSVFITKQNPENELKMLIETNPKNRMAYEYLQTYYLLHNDVIKFVKNICNMSNIGFNFLPNIYEEGIITYYYMINQKTDTLCGYTISDASKYRFEGYKRALSQFGGNFESAEPFLKETFGTTYWFYLHFVSPITLKKEITIEHE